MQGPVKSAGGPLGRRARAAFPGFRLRWVARTPSTMDLARAAAAAGAPEGWCVVAAEQTGGRGRQGRSWSAPAGGGLLLSLVVRRAAPAGWLQLAAGVAVAEGIEACTGVTARVKWPNDVLAPGGGKLAGLLAETVTSDGGPRPVVLGVGVNVSVDTFPAGVRGESLHRLARSLPTHEELLVALLEALGNRLAVLDGPEGVDATAAAWCERAVGLGTPVSVEAGGRVLRGTATGLDADGALVVVDGGGGEHHLVAGDVHLGGG